jgi:hypothetical protein
MQFNGVENIVRLIIAGIFGIAALSFIAKDGQQIGAFLGATGDAFGKFAKGVQAT